MGAEELLSWFSKLANKIKSRFPEDYPKVLYQETYGEGRREHCKLNNDCSYQGEIYKGG